MPHLPWYVGGFVLAAVTLAHWFLTGRMLAVSSRYTALVDRLRFGPSKTVSMSTSELLLALQRATADEFGQSTPAVEPQAASMSKKTTSPPTLLAHLCFLGALIAGGALSVLLTGHWQPQWGIAGMEGMGDATRLFSLILGGVLVGVGTRMAGGCTSGHGLCGVSTGQVGSLVSTMAFFGAGIGASFLLEMLF